MKNKNSNTKTLPLIVLAIILIAGFAVWYAKRPEKTFASLDGFAQCLAEKKVTMYGAAWCSHCQNEKRAFGDSFKYVPYVECPENAALCKEKGVEGYPTWIFPDGRMLVGEQGLKGLAAASSCALPSSQGAKP